MSGSIKTSLARRIMQAVKGPVGQAKQRRRSGISLVENLEPRLLLAAARSTSAARPKLEKTAPAPRRPGPALPPSGPSQTSPGNLAPLNQTFQLHSRPSATKTIYLDFDGHTTSGTIWNTTFTNGAAFTTPAFSLDANGSSFNASELIQIQNIWQSVAEDFAPFDVNVTTQAPPVSDLINSGGADNRWGIRVVIGGTDNQWFTGGAGGVAYLTSFTWDSDTPCYVFADTQFDFEDYIVLAATHEVGHTLGLSHDGTAALGYYGGHGTGSMSWAPIMGAGYDIAITQWSKGEYSGANNKEDDLAIITQTNGFDYRNDDYGNSILMASELPSKKVGSTRTVSASGVIERNTDQDWFSFTTTGGLVNLNFAPDSRDPNLKIAVGLYDMSGTLISTVNSATSLDATLLATLPAGTYSIQVDGVGFGTLANGFSDYGSLGQYTITGTIPDTSSGSSTGGTSIIEGQVISDANNDGILNGSDAGIQGVMVFRDVDGNGVFNAAVDQSARTDALGRFKFTGLRGGMHTIYQMPLSGWQQASPSSAGLTVFVAAASTSTGNNFRNVRPPVLSGIGATVTYNSKSVPVLITSTANVADADNLSFNGARLTVGLTAGAGATDLISIRNQGNGAGQVGAFAGFVRYAGVTVGTVSGGIAGSSLVITFNSKATLTAIRAVMRNITFSATNPSKQARTVSFSMTDGAGGSSLTYSKQIRIV